ncbi:PAS domain-containing sensor histidine kinase [Sphingomonas limnosediminicola]|uniref:histidine kinase n=2 Tax=Sphingomonas limnosediminicola TaxID=940133 RepID=A0ABP7LK51_9SPHN
MGDPRPVLWDGGEAGALMRSLDWSHSPLGQPADWPQPLRSVVSLMLGSKFPMFVAWGPELGFLYNDAYAVILGAKHPEAMGARFKDVWSEIWEDVGPLAHRALNGEATWLEDLPLVMNRKGFDEQTWFTFSYSPVRDDAGQIAGMFCAVAETTDKIVAQRRLADEAERQRRLFERAPGFITVLTGPDHRFDFVNEAYARLFGQRQFLGRTVREVFPELEGQGYFEWLDGVYATGERFVAQTAPAMLQLEPDAPPVQRFLDFIYEPVVDEQGQVTGIFCEGHDVTERMAAETELRELAETLEHRVAERTSELEQAQEALRQSQKLEAMGQLTGGVAHDFNNLLTPITGTLDLLQRRNFGDERTQRQIAGALASAERAKVLVQRLLAFARRQPLQLAGVDIVRLVGEIADLIASTSGPKIKVELDLANDSSAAFADANQLEMALLNLAVNARDAMPDGGLLTIAVNKVVIGAGHRSKLATGEYVRLAVSDTGVGMDEETLVRAIEPFFSTKGIGQGTGLGLSMVHGLALQLGGALTLASRSGVGTTAELWLRAAPSAAAPSLSRTHGADDDLQVGTVLLVDDEELVRESTADMLSDMGFNVIQARSAECAMKLISEGLQPDLVVTDHLMPGMSGTDLAFAMREKWPGKPVLIVSGYAETAGMDPNLPRLTKPFRRRDLAAAISLCTATAAA